MSDWNDQWDDDWESPIFDDENHIGKNRGAFFGIGALLLILGVIVGYLVFSLDQKEDKIEQPAERVASIRKAFEAEDIGVVEDLEHELEGFFDRLMQASLDRDKAALKEMIDIPHYLQRVKNCNVITTMSSLEELNLREHVEDDTYFQLGWKDHTIIHIDPLGEPGEYLVFVHLSNEELSAQDNLRCWVARTPRGWALFDWEFLDRGMPDSVEEAIRFEYSLDPRMDEYFECLVDIHEAYRLAREGEDRAAEEKVQSAERRNVHPKLADLASLRIAYVASFLGDWRRCLDAAERISSPDKVPGAYYAKALVFDAWGHYRQVAVAARKYEELVGINPPLLEIRCRALDQLSWLEEAVPSLQKWLRFEPDNVQAMQYFGRALPGDQKKLLVEHLARVAEPIETAVSLTEYFTYNYEPEVLQELIRFVEEDDPEAPRVDYLNGLVERAEGNFEQAADLFLKAHQSEQEEEQKDSFREEYFQTMYTLGRTVEAYEAISDRKAAFQSLAQWFDLEEEDTASNRKRLRELIDAHRKHDPDDPWLHYHTGVLLAAEGKYDDANQELLLAAESEDEDLISMTGYERTAVLIEAGRGLEAYESADSPEETFKQLASRYEWREKPEELRDLIAAHKAKVEDDPWLKYYEGVACLLEKKYEQADRLFEKEYLTGQDELIKDACHSKLIDTKFEFRGVLNAYRDLDFSEEAFQRYANRLSSDERWNDLRTLVELHERKHPEDPNLHTWKIDLLWRAKDYATIVRKYGSSLPIELEEMPEWQTSALKDKVLRSYLRSDQVAGAIEFAESLFRETGATEKLLVAHLAAGNLIAARLDFELYDQSAWSLAWIYADEDVGERLFSKEFSVLREQFPPPIPYNFGTEVSVLFFDEVPSLPSMSILELVVPILGPKIEIMPIQSDTEQTSVLVRSDGLGFVFTVGNSSYHGTVENAGNYSRDLKDPRLKSVLTDHQGWIALDVLKGRQSRLDDRDLAVAYQLVEKILNDNCLGLYLADGMRLAPNTSAVRTALLSESPDAELEELGEEIWIYREQPIDPAESLAIERCQARLHQFVRAFRSRTPDQEFQVQVRLSANHASETHWIGVERIEKKSYGNYRIIGRFQSDSRLIRELRSGEPVVVGKYDVRDWNYREGEAIVEGRMTPAD